MITRMPDMPGGVLAFEAHGEVTGDDYENVLVPAVRDELAGHDKIRCLYVLGSDFTGYDGAALWDDTKVGLDHWGAWERIALVPTTARTKGSSKRSVFSCRDDSRCSRSATEMPPWHGSLPTLMKTTEERPEQAARPDPRARTLNRSDRCSHAEWRRK